MQTRLSDILARCLPALLVLAAGCSPASDAERAYSEARDREGQQRELVRRALEGGSEESAAIRLAKESPSPAGTSQATGAWLEAQVQELEKGADVLLPHWQARRRGVGRFEVSYTYTVRTDDGRVERHGWAWDVDLVLKLVSPGRELTPEDLRPRVRHDREVPEREELQTE